jgi:hypothetical protein
MYKFLISAAISLSLCGTAIAQTAARGTPVLNQGISAAAITVSDVTVLTPTRAIYIGDAAACNIAVRFVKDTSAVTLANVPSGSFLPITVDKVMNTNTTCTSIVGIW